MDTIYLLKRLGNAVSDFLSIGLRLHQYAFARRCGKTTGAIKNILAIKIWGIGNITLLMPLFKAIKETYPDSTLYLLTLDSNKGLTKNFPYLCRTICFTLTKNPIRIAVNFLKNLLAVRKLNIDLLINFEQCNSLSTIFSYMAGAKKRVGFSLPRYRQKNFYTQTLKNNPQLHVTQNFTNLCRLAGININRYVYLAPYTNPLSQNKVKEALLCKNLFDRKIVAIHAGSGINFIGKRWKPSNFAKLADGLIERHGVKTVFTGTRDEFNLTENIISQMVKPALNFCGKFTLPELVEFLKYCYLFVSNDTGPLHIAISLKINTVGIYGPMSPAQYGSLNENSISFYKQRPCSPCLKDLNNKTSFCMKTKCLDDITAEEVIEKITERFFHGPDKK